MADYWKILRILTTNKCNYRCLYCHNEGQKSIPEAQTLAFEDFQMILRCIQPLGFREIRLSGGEPLLNPDTIRMLEWLDATTDYEIGLATNGSLINEDVVSRISRTRTLLTLHYPAMDKDSYSYITGHSDDQFLEAIRILDKYDISYSFNYVLYPKTINCLDSVLDVVIRAGKRIKLLPYIESGFNNQSEDLIKGISDKLDSIAISKEQYDVAGITVWTFAGGGKAKLLHSPCYDHSVDRCREYGELRLLPDLSIQRCIFETESVSLKGMTEKEIRDIITAKWESFTHCI